MALVLAGASGAAQAEDSFRPARFCAQCHPEIYRTWHSSRHASANTAPPFRLSLDRMGRENTLPDRSCEFCHDPVLFFLEPDDPKAAIFAQEGVTCDFCHSVEFLIQGIEGAGFPRYLVNPAITFGPHPEGGESSGKPHRTKFSSMHILSVFCAGCHEYRNSNGVPILSTYSEWEKSFYRGEGVQCQFCHLPGLFDAPFLDPARKKGPIGHDMAGGHSRELLARALPVRATLTRAGEEARVTVLVKNDFVGHNAPSGFPVHRLRIDTTVYDARRGILGRAEEIFERVLGDGQGSPLRRPEQFFAVATEVLKDNRIAPKEVRKVVQRFPLNGTAPATAEIALLYETYLPGLGPGAESTVTPIVRIVVTLESGPPRGLVALVILAAAGVVFVAALAFRRRRA
ncbi:MAG: multiheme c-type cytochrome [Gemmatimonadota bacterium]